MTGNPTGGHHVGAVGRWRRSPFCPARPRRRGRCHVVPGRHRLDIVGTILPGLGFLKARRWFEGTFTLLCFVLLAGGVGYLAYQRTFAIRLTTSHITLLGIAVLCGMLGIL